MKWWRGHLLGEGKVSLPRSCGEISLGKVYISCLYLELSCLAGKDFWTSRVQIPNPLSIHSYSTPSCFARWVHYGMLYLCYFCHIPLQKAIDFRPYGLWWSWGRSKCHYDVCLVPTYISNLMLQHPELLNETCAKLFELEWEFKIRNIFWVVEWRLLMVA